MNGGASLSRLHGRFAFHTKPVLRSLAGRKADGSKAIRGRHHQHDRRAHLSDDAKLFLLDAIDHSNARRQIDGSSSVWLWDAL